MSPHLRSWGAARVRCETGPRPGGQGGTEERGRQLQIVGSRLNKEGNPPDACLGRQRVGNSLPPPTRILRVSTRDLDTDTDGWAQRHLALSQGCVLELVPNVGKMGRRYMPGIGEGARSLQVPGSGSLANRPAHLPDLPQCETCFECQHSALGPSERPGLRSWC